jgi:hypothetical protein
MFFGNIEVVRLLDTFPNQNSKFVIFLLKYISSALGAVNDG